MTTDSQVRGFVGTLAAILLNWQIVMGLACAVVAALTWIQALARSSLSLAYPFMALAIVLVLALSGVVLGEKVPVTRWIGVGVVCVGIFVASR
jgi:drug/metabolite transporter (DMT)-like permease